MNNYNITHKAKDLTFVSESKYELLTFLKEHLKGKSVNNIKSILSRKQVSVDGITTTQYNYPVTEGCIVKVMSNAPKKAVTCKLKIIYEDERMIVINKPAGLLTISTEKEKEHTAYHMVLEYIKSKDTTARIYIVHRLDKDTSGIIIFAKDTALKEALQNNWNELVKVREYIAVAEGTFRNKESTLISYLAETKTHLIYSTNDKNSGKKAITHYKVLKENKEYSLLQINIDTGRKNQIRVQLNDCGHPVAGDKKYGALTNPFGRMALHCCKLTFINPLDEKEMSFTAVPDNRFYTLFD